MNINHIDVPFEIKDISDDGTFKGIASPFGGKADSYGDIIQQGAFANTLKKGGRNGSGIPVLWQHKTDEPIGIYTKMIETSKNLEVEGKLVMEVQRAKEAHALMKVGAVGGLSIGWDFPRGKDGRPIKESFFIDPTNNTRLLKEIVLWEVSPVTFPAQTRARITGVKEFKDVRDVRDFEDMLRDQGLSRNQAVYIAGLCKRSLGEAPDQTSILLENLNQVIKSESEMSTGLGSLLDCLNKTNQEFRS